jgi:cell fate (sporulation/competence/biofilm development) regulator YlbF (YheA/YmcA/DUF963 family)
MEKNEFIIEKARELSRLIENHEITIRYRDSLDKMKNDAVAQRLLADLIRIGGEINALIEKNAESSTGRAELEILKAEFEENKTVKDHILAQKEYLNLIKMVQERIKNPEM